MKKVLIIVLGVLGLGALLGGFMVFRTMQANKLIKELSKFELPEWGFDGYVELVSLKYKPPKEGFTSTTKPSYLKTLTSQPAPLHEVKVQGDAITPKLAAIAKDASKPENVRCAAAIILAHQASDTKKKDEIITALVDAMQEKEGRVGECASVMAQKVDSDAVPTKLAEVLKSATEPKVRMNVLRGITLWVIDEPKRKKNKTVMEEVLKGVEEKDKATLLMVLGNSRRLQFQFDAKEGKKSLGDQLVEKVLPMITSADEEIAKAAAVALEWQYSYMSDDQKKDAIKLVAPFAAADRTKTVRLLGLSLLRRINGELAQNSATIGECDLDAVMALLEDKDPDFHKPVLECMKQCGTTQPHRQAVKNFKDATADEGLKKLAGEAIEQILKREEGGE